MSDALRYQGVQLRHDGAASKAVGPVSFNLEHGERALILGPSGAGKSTLLHAATGLLPHSIAGTREGDIRINGQPVDSRTPADWADTCGYLFQDAAQTLAGFTVRDEIAFACENQRIPGPRIPDLVSAAMARAGIGETWANRRITTLSGGERQCVALAALLAQNASIILADEPSASLAPRAARRMTDLLLRPGCTTLIVEHKPGPMLDHIDRCIALNLNGEVMAEGTCESVILEQASALQAAGIALPVALRLHLEMPAVIAPALKLEHSLAGLSRRQAGRVTEVLLPAPVRTGETLVSLTNAACAPAFGPVVLRDVSLSLHAGEVLAVVGPNGAGKSTLACCLAGLVAPRSGRREGAGGAVVFQNPEAHFSRESVQAELSQLGLPEGASRGVLERWGLLSVANQHPFSLSQGQKRRLALALLSETDRWPVLILDEPTAGLDGAAEHRLRQHIRRLVQAGRGIVVITHDLDFALSVAERALLVDQGSVTFDGCCRELMLDTDRLTRAGLLPPEAAPFLHWLEATC